MKLDARMLNLLGVLVLVAVLGLGTTQIALPIYEGVQTTESDIEAQRQTNAALQTRLVELDEAEQRRPEIIAGIADLRAALPENQQSASALQMIENSLVSTGVFIDGHSVGVPETFVPRIDESPGAAELAAIAAASAETEAAAEEEAAAETPEGEAAPPADPAAAGPVDGPQQQIEFTLELSVPDEPTAIAFIDGLRAGPRLVLPTSAEFSRGSTPHQVTTWEPTLTVTMLVYAYEEVAQ